MIYKNNLLIYTYSEWNTKWIILPQLSKSIQRKMFLIYFGAFFCFSIEKPIPQAYCCLMKNIEEVPKANSAAI